MLKLDKVSKFYSGNGVITAGMTNVSLEFEKGEFAAITGESGSGKSTLMNVISGLDSYEEGEMYIYGEPTSGFSKAESEEYRRKYISNIFQSFNLVAGYTVYRNIELVLLLAGMSAEDAKPLVEDVMAKTGLTELSGVRAAKLSGGQKQRVAIARALVKDTPVIIADEPTGNLDEKSAKEIIELLYRISEDKLVIIVTHNYEQVKPFVTRKITMHDGHVVENEKIREKRSGSGKEQEAVYERGAKPLSAIRLGVRNTFNIGSRFALLFLALFFLTVGTFGTWGCYRMNQNAAGILTGNGFFQDASNRRIIVKKSDGKPFAERELEKIAAMRGIKEIDTMDILRDSDSTFTVRGTDDCSIRSYMTDAQIYRDYLKEGRMPEKENEALFVYNADSQWGKVLGAEKVKPGAEFEPDSTTSARIKVTGIAEVDRNSAKGKAAEQISGEASQLGDSIFGFTEAGLRCRMKESIINSAETFITTGGKSLQSLTAAGALGEIDCPVITTDSVKEGTAILPKELKPYVKDDRICLNVKTPYYSEKKEFSVTGYYDRYNRKELLGESYYNENEDTMGIYINRSDCLGIVPDGTFQISVYSESSGRTGDVDGALQSMGYETLQIRKTEDENSFDSAMKLFSKGIFVMMLAVLFVISYLIIRLILKSQNSYYAIVRMLGGTVRNCRDIIISEVVIVSTITFAVYSAIIAVTGKMPFTGGIREVFMSVEKQIGGTDFVVVYITLIVLSVLIAARYSRTLFRKTAVNAYREEV